jgi:hypothetical protein
MYSSRNTGFDRWQIGYISVPSGEFGEVTRDTNYYVGLSLPAAKEYGFELQGNHILPRKSVIIDPKWKKASHPRQNHSTWMAFKKKVK